MSAQDALIALGILSAPEYVERRSAMRSSWLKLIRPHLRMAYRFVVRCGCVPEPAKHIADWAEADLLRVHNICLSETRVRAPILLLDSWLRFALTSYNRAVWVAKLDDDVWLRPQAIAAMLAATSTMYSPGQASTRRFEPSPYVFLGAIQFSSWRDWRGVGFAYQRFVARPVPGAVGPFAFAAGYFIVLSRGLAALVVESSAIAAEVARVRSLVLPARRKLVFEDVWLGAMVYQHVKLPKPHPLVLVDLQNRARIVADYDGMRMQTTALVWHNRMKEPSRMRLIDERFQPGPEASRLRGAATGGGDSSLAAALAASTSANAPPPPPLPPPSCEHTGPLRCRRERGWLPEHGAVRACSFNATRCTRDLLDDTFVIFRNLSSDGYGPWFWAPCRVGGGTNPILLEPTERDPAALQAARACGLPTQSMQ